MHQVLVFSTSSMDAKQSPLTLSRLTALCQPIDGVGAFTWLAPACAAETTVRAITDDQFAQLRADAAAHQIDVNCVTPQNRRKSLLIADMDSTIIQGESLDDMAAMVGLGDQISAITARAMAGELDFEAALDARVAMLAGYPDSLFESALDETELTPGAMQLVGTMATNGAHCYLVSGGFTAIVDPIADLCGFHGCHANEMITEDGEITGTVRKPVLGRDAKAEFLQQYCHQHGLDLAQSIAVGDGANDAAMLAAAGCGVAFHGKPLLREMIPVQLNFTDLTGLLFLQGYYIDDFAIHQP